MTPLHYIGQRSGSFVGYCREGGHQIQPGETWEDFQQRTGWTNVEAGRRAVRFIDHLRLQMKLSQTRRK